MNEFNPNAAAGELLDGYHAARSRHKRLTRIGQGLTLVLVVVFVGFLVSLYGKMTTMYAAEKFEQPLQEEARNLIPLLEPELRALWEQTAPVYEQLAREKLATVLPAVQEATYREFDVLLTNVEAQATRHIQDAVKRIVERHHDRIRGHFPILASAESAEERGEQWMESISDDLRDIIVHLHTRYLTDLGELEATLEQFFPNEFEAMSEDQLTRQFIHIWLMKADQLVMQGKSSEGNDHAS